MKIEKKVIDKERGIVQVTTTDERWYTKSQEDGSVKFVPSVTWICGHYPKGVEFFKWLASKGWDEAEAIKQAAGDKGSKVHKAIEFLLSGIEIKHDAKFLNHSTGEQEELTVQEYEAIMSFKNWLDEVNPEVISTEYNIFNDELGYAGTVDMKLKIDGEIWIVDIKTSANIWPEYELQLSAYRHADKEAQRTAILQVGYRYNKTKKYKFTEIQDKFPLFLAAKQIWANECEGIHPFQKDYPLSLKWEQKKLEIGVSVEEAIKKTVPAKKKKVVRRKLKRVEALKKQLK